MRLVQFGTDTEAYVLPVERDEQFCEVARGVLLDTDELIFQNGMFDLQVFDRHLGVPMEKLWPKVTDTKIYAHLADPRGPEEGGIGTSLEPLAAKYIDPVVATEVKGLMSRLAKEYKTNKNRIWSLIDLDHPEYNLYAGMDTILAYRLVEPTLRQIPGRSRALIPYEHKIAEICSYLERTGFLLDEAYTRSLADSLASSEQSYRDIATTYGVESVNSTDQVADVLESMGVVITGRTPTGKRKVDKHLLAELVGDPGDVGRFARSVVECKRARKWRTTWVEGFLRGMDADGRVHASINALRARTARMSVTGIPAQTLPANDRLVRSCFIADPGHVIGSVDYAAQELRVTAWLADDPTMLGAFERGDNLHLMTAHSAFGAHITKEDPEYKFSKIGNFGTVYGGGIGALVEQTGMTEEAAREIKRAIRQNYPGIGQLSRKLAREAEDRGYIETSVGRRLPVDQDRLYAALNYRIQSESRDITCQGLIRLHEQGYTPFLRLPIHDEALVSVPEVDAEFSLHDIASIMATTKFTRSGRRVDITTDAEIYGRSWGDGYRDAV